MHDSSKLQGKIVQFEKRDIETGQITTALVLKIGRVGFQPDSAGSVVEILDWAGDIDDYIKDKRSFDGVSTGVMSYATCSRALTYESLPNDIFEEKVIETIINQAKEELAKGSDGGFRLKFKPTSERCSLLRYLMKNSKVTGLTL